MEAPAVARRTSHVLVPCRADAAGFVRRSLARDLTSWQVDEAVAEGLLLAAAEAVLDTVAARAPSAGMMLVISWTLDAGRPDDRHWFRFAVVERGLPAPNGRAVATRAHPAAMAGHPALGERRCVMDAVMDRVVVSNGTTGPRIVLEKTFPATATA